MYKKILFILLINLVIIGCEGSGEYKDPIDTEGGTNTTGTNNTTEEEQAYKELKNTINSNSTITADELNKIDKVSTAQSGIDYSQDLKNATYKNRQSPTADEVNIVISLKNRIVNTINGDETINTSFLKDYGIVNINDNINYNNFLKNATYLDSNNPSRYEIQQVINNTNGKVVEEKYYGYWKYLDTGEEIKIDKSSLLTFNKIGENFIKIDNRPLLRNGSNDATIKGSVYNLVLKTKDETTNKVKYSTLFQKTEKYRRIKVRINDGFRTKEQEISNENKNFFFPKMSIGDVGVIITGEKVDENNNDENNNRQEEEIFNETFHINNKDTDLGNFYITENNIEDNIEDNSSNKVPTYNFKTTQVIDLQDKDDRYMYENRTYNGKLKFKNTGDNIAEGLNYTISTNDPYVESITSENILNSLEANKTAEIPFEISFRTLNKMQHRVKLDFLIRDANSNEWLDNVFLDVYQTPISLVVTTKSSSLKGYIITPEQEIIDINTNNIEVKVPKRVDGKYYFVVLEPNTISEETAYSFAIDSSTQSFDTFKETDIFEPNDTEEEATPLKLGDSNLSFINVGDIDFYTINFDNNLSFTPPQLPFF